MLVDLCELLVHVRADASETEFLVLAHHDMLAQLRGERMSEGFCLLPLHPGPP